MNTQVLIETLARQGPGGPRKPGRWILLPLAASLLVCLAALIAVLGRPLAALPGIGAAPYMMKLAFAVSVATLSAFAMQASGVPGQRHARRLTVLAIPFAAVLTLAGMEIAAIGIAGLGRTWLRCLTTITLLTPLGFTACAISLRSLAPTNLRLSGALAGVVSGSIAASAYALWCPETTAVFLFLWYALPILAAGGVGALLGPRLLRW